MKKKLLYLPLFAFLLIGFGSISFAQNGGKAEGKPIQFKRGATSGVVSDTIKNDLEYEYTFKAKAGQLATIKISSTPKDSATFEIRLDGEPVAGEMNEAGTVWSGSLPSDGEYWISVKRKSASKGTSKFSLTLSIK